MNWLIINSDLSALFSQQFLFPSSLGLSLTPFSCSFALCSDDDFKALNSELNKEVSTFEASPYFEPWSPTSSSSESNRTTSHRLNEEELERVWEKLNFGEEDLVDAKRERVGNAAEERMRREKAERSQ